MSEPKTEQIIQETQEALYAGKMTRAYPELEKLSQHCDTLDDIAEFEEWLNANGYAVVDEQNAPVNIEKLAWQWLGIDAAKVEQERQQLLKELKS